MKENSLEMVEKLDLIKLQCEEWCNENGYEILSCEVFVLSDDNCGIRIQTEFIELTGYFDLDKIRDFLHLICQKRLNQSWWHMNFFSRSVQGKRIYDHSNKTGHLQVLLARYNTKQKVLC